MSKNRNKGFTLIELLVVIAIIGILAAIVLVNINNVRSKARDVIRKADFKAIQNALEMYRVDHDDYPQLPEGLCASDWDYCWADGGSFATVLKPYLNTLPQDPRFNDKKNVACGGDWFAYVYVYTGPDTYCLGATLESNSPDPECASACDAGWSNYNLRQ